MLRDEFYFNCKYTNNTAQIKYTFFNYKPFGKWSFTTTPAPRTGSEVKGEILRINDENGFWLSRIRKQMELAGKEIRFKVEDGSVVVTDITPRR